MRQLPRLAASLLTAAVVAAVAVTVVLLRPSAPATSTAGQRSGHQPRRSQTVESPRDAAVAAVRRLLAAAPVVPHAARLDHPPAPAVRGPMTESAGNTVDRGGWWIAPGTVHAALSYFRGHLPPGLSADGSSHSSGPNEPTVNGLVFSARTDRDSPDLVSLQLLVSAVQLGSRVGLRVDAQSAWVQRRAAAETIPASVTTVDVVVTRPGRASTVRRTLGAGPARQLAGVINRLRVGVNGFHSCPAYLAGATDELTFSASGTEIAVSANVGGCEQVDVSADGTAQPYLQGTPEVDRTVLATLHLPRHYGELP